MNIKTIITTVGLIALTTVGASAADYFQGLPGVEKPKNYIGITGGFSAQDKGKGAVGAVIGRDVTENITIEGQYDYREGDSHLATGNVLLGVPVGNIKPYGLVGVGYKWTPNRDGVAYVAGAGIKFTVTDKIELDGRYRYVNGSGSADNRITAGINFKF